MAFVVAVTMAGLGAVGYVTGPNRTLVAVNLIYAYRFSNWNDAKKTGNLQMTPLAYVKELCPTFFGERLVDCPRPLC